MGGGRAFPSDQGGTATFVRVDVGGEGQGGGGGAMTECLVQTETEIGFIHDFLLGKKKIKT